MFTESIISYMSRLPTSIVCMCRQKMATPLTASQQQLFDLTAKKRAVVMFSLCSNVESTTRLLTDMTKNRSHLLLHLRLVGLLSRPLETCGASHCSFKNTSVVTPCNATIATSCEPSELVASLAELP